MDKIKTINELKKLATFQMLECFILLNGNLRSSKQITYHPVIDRFDVLNEIDDTFQENLTETELELDTNIIEAIDKGALYKY